MEFKNCTFKIMEAKYTIKYVDSIESDKEGLFMEGRCNSSTKTILVATKDIEGNPVQPKVLRVVLLHELIHAILDEGQYCNSSADEPLVEWLAKCINTLLEQKIL